MDREPVYVVFNPRAGKGRGGRLFDPVLRSLLLRGPVQHDLTTAPGDEERLASRAIAQGFKTIVAVGGDGTWSNVAGAILRSGAPVSLGLIPAGTGCDLAKSLGIPADDLPACARIVEEGCLRTIDVGRVEDKYFLNVVGFGFDIAVIEHSWKVRYLDGHLLYLYSALRQLYSFPGFRMGFSVDGVFKGREQMLMVVVANARVFGGGFHIAPGADLEDGCLDAVVFRNMPWRRRLPLLVRLRRGTHAGAPEVTFTRARSYRLSFDSPPAYETDGEWNQARANELQIETLPSALRVLVPAPS